MKQAILNFLRDEEGATAIEYGLIAGLIAVVLITTLSALGTDIGAAFKKISEKLQEVVKP